MKIQHGPYIGFYDDACQKSEMKGLECIQLSTGSHSWIVTVPLRNLSQYRLFYLFVNSINPALQA